MIYKFINTDYLDSVTAGDVDTMHEIIKIFREQIAEFHSEMMSLLEKKEYYSLGLLAHKAKSSVAIMGMSDLASMLKAFEMQAKEGKETEKYESYVSRFGIDTQEAMKELEDLEKNHK
ncbi:MAG: Hpt domain-containing protein [Bacteroidales bacterium]|jgi:HPt (histidine-containing phosphotransfer) domain-containing protein